MQRKKKFRQSSIMMSAFISGAVSILGGAIAVIQPFKDVATLKLIYDYLTPEMQKNIITFVLGFNTLLSGIIAHARASNQNPPITNKQAIKAR